MIYRNRKNKRRPLPDQRMTKHVLFLQCVCTLAFCLISLSARAEIYEDAVKYHPVIEQLESDASVNDIFKKWQEELSAQPLPEGADRSYGRYRFGQDKVFLQKSLAAEGYYRGTVDGHYDEASRTAHFTINAGQQYRFGAVRLIVEPKDSQIKLPELSSLKAKSDDPALARTVLGDVERIDTWIEKNNCLFTHRTDHEAVIKHLQHRVDITYRVKVGDQATFGDITFSGNNSIADLHLQRRVKIKPGECFKRSKLGDARLALQRSGLVAKAEPQLPDAPLADGSVPVTFVMRERVHRSIKAGTNYSTDIGPGVSAGWEHRNFFNHGEKFTTGLSVATLEQHWDTTLEKPFFLREDQRLKLAGVLRQEDSDAFRTTGLTLSGGIERDLTNQWIAGVGASYGFEQIKDQDNKENVALFSLPIFLSQDKRDDLLNPTRGWTVSLNTAPSFDTIDATTSFIKNSTSGSYYHALDVAGQPVIAMRAAIGGIFGVSSETVPATERFYTGGGGSVRGYGYQLAGPLDAQNDPLGGRSFVELSTELRLRVAEDYGVVSFVDGGNTFDAAYPDFNGGLLWGAGLGLRYYTDFGPIRADIAVPLDKRPGVDDAYQLYFSIGQAF